MEELAPTVLTSSSHDLEAGLSANRNLQTLIHTRLSQLNARLDYLSAMRTGLVGGPHHEAASQRGSTSGGVKRARHGTNTRAVLAEGGCAASDGDGDEAAPSAEYSSRSACAFPQKTASLATATVLRAAGTSGDPFRDAGAFTDRRQRIVQFAPIPPTADAVRQKHLDDVYPVDWWVRTASRRHTHKVRAAPSQAPRRADPLVRNLLLAFTQRNRPDSVVRVSGVLCAASLQDATGGLQALEAPLRDVMRAHFGDVTHLRNRVYDALLHVFQLHFPRSEWIPRFCHAINLPRRDAPVTCDEALSSFAALVVCGERDLVTRSSGVAADWLFFRTIDLALGTACQRGGTHIPEIMVHLLSASGAPQWRSVAFFHDKCAVLRCNTERLSPP